MAKDILKEAIADAKAVREVALANAKAALEEAFTPKLQSMLSAKLSEELNEEDNMEEMGVYDEEKDMEEMNYGNMEDDEMEETVGMEKEGKDDLDEEIDLEEILNELELEEAKDEDKVDEAKKDDDDVNEGSQDSGPFRGTVAGKPKSIKTKVDTYAGDAAKEGKEDDDAKKEAKDDKEKMEEDLEEVHSTSPKASDVQRVSHDAADVYESEEFDLDSLLKEIESLEEKEDDDSKKEAKDDMKEADETNEVVGTAIAGTAAAIIIGGTPLVAAKAAYDMVSPEKKAELMKKYPKLSKLMDTLGLVGKSAGDVRRSESLSEAEEAASEDELAKMEKALASGSSMEEDMYQEELEETKAALETVRAELNEVNLLNSKLLYVNRIFKANTLDESQKLRVVETIDKAETAKEAKLIYETIKDTFNVAKSKKESFKSKTKSLKEGIGMASKAAGTSTAPKKEVISESNNIVNRFQKLANIKINQ